MPDTSIKDFETAIAELESIVKKLEEGELPLEQSLALYERGVQLSRFCHSRLEDAERRIEILNERGELKPAPASLGATATSPTDIALTWAASTDNVGVTNYVIERCVGAGCATFAQVGTSTTTNFSDAGLTGSTTYSYQEIGRAHV